MPERALRGGRVGTVEKEPVHGRPGAGHVGSEGAQLTQLPCDR